MIASVIARRRGHYEPSPEVRKSAVRASGSAHTGCLLSVECRRCRLHQAMSAQPVRTLRADPQKRTMLVPALRLSFATVKHSSEARDWFRLDRVMPTHK